MKIIFGHAVYFFSQTGFRVRPRFVDVMFKQKKISPSANLIQDVKVFRCKCAAFTPYLLHPQNKELQGALVTCGAYLVIAPRETEIIEAVVDNWIVYILKAK